MEKPILGNRDVKLWNFSEVLDSQRFDACRKTININALKGGVKFYFRKCLIFKDFPMGM